MPGSSGFRGWFAAAIVCIVVAPLAANESAAPVEQKERQRSRLELGVFDGLILPDKHLTGTDDPGVRPTAGVRMSGGMARRWNWFAEAQIARFDSRAASGDAKMLAGRGGVEWLMAPGRRAEPFVSLGWGYMNLTFPNASDFFSGFASTGLGQHVQIGPRSRLRWEIRIDRTTAPDGLRGNDLTQPQATLAYSWVLGKSKLDADHDGVPGHRDRCRDTPEGALVDERGCARDTDRDGVPDGLDTCTETPTGWAVGPEGCPLDADGDGVADGIDKCPASPEGALIDENGCPRDTDEDGVFDGLDRCPATLKGIEVDARGCFLDADEDGVYDGLGMDRCPGTPKGTKVDRFGCPVEEDRGD